MTETTRDIILTFCENARQNALKLGAVQTVEFTLNGIIIDGEMKISEESVVLFLDFSKISYGFRLSQLVRMLRSVSESAEGTSVVFVHGFEQGIVERLASVCGFRVYEHFNVARVVKELCGEDEEGEISFCLAVKK